MHHLPAMLSSRRRTHMVSLATRGLSAAVGFGLLGMALAVIGDVTIVDLDLYHEMAIFRSMLQVGSMPRADVFAYTPTHPLVVHHEWGTGAAFYLLTVSAGLGAAGLVAAKYLLSFAIVLGCYANARQRGAELAVFAFLAPLALGLGWIGFTTVRAQVFTLLFLVILLFFLNVDGRGRRWWIWGWLPLVFIWANLHAGVLVGLGILAIDIVARFFEAWRDRGTMLEACRDTRYLLVVGAASLATLQLTPYGWDYVPYLIRAVLMERPLIQEWKPLWQVEDWQRISGYLLSALIASYGIWRSGIGGSETGRGRAQRMFEPAVLLVSAWMAASHVRHLSIYAAAWICLVPSMIQATPLGAAMQRSWRNRAVWLVVIWTAIGVWGVSHAVHHEFWRLQIPTDPARARPGAPIYPVGAVEYLRSHDFTGNLMVPFTAGAFVSWQLAPAVKVSNDSRYEVAYPSGLIEEIAALYEGASGWQSTLEKYPTHAVLVPRGAPLEELLLNQTSQASGDAQPAEQFREGRWRKVYQDAGYALFVDPVRFPTLPVRDRSDEIIRGEFP